MIVVENVFISHDRGLSAGFGRGQLDFATQVSGFTRFQFILALAKSSRADKCASTFEPYVCMFSSDPQGRKTFDKVIKAYD